MLHHDQQYQQFIAFDTNSSLSFETLTMKQTTGLNRGTKYFDQTQQVYVG
jgi:hypothetical protein